MAEDKPPEKGWFGLSGGDARFYNLTAMGIITAGVLYFVHQNASHTAAELAYLRDQIEKTATEAKTDRKEFLTRLDQAAEERIKSTMDLTIEIRKALVALQEKRP
jgi:uncharacterized protein HemX